MLGFNGNQSMETVYVFKTQKNTTSDVAEEQRNKDNFLIDEYIPVS